MPSADYSKATCPSCNGHVEYPTASAGTTITCPHCQAEMTLTVGVPDQGILKPADATASLGLKAPMMAIMVALITAAAILIAGPDKKPETVEAAVPTNGLTAAAPKPSAEFPLPDGWQRPILPPSGDLELLGFKLESQPGSSLKHVIGLVTNRSNARYFGVKVEFNMIDSSGSTVGNALDQTTTMTGQSGWQFRALSVGGKPVKASALKLSGEKE